MSANLTVQKGVSCWAGYLSQQSIAVLQYLMKILSEFRNVCGESPPVVWFIQDTKGKIWFIVGLNSRDSCRNLVKKLEMLPLKSQYSISFFLLFLW
jgi:hypothetical protein